MAQNKYVGEKLTVVLSGHQLGRIAKGCSSTWTDSDLVAVGVAHLVLKHHRGLPGDKYVKWKAQYEGPDTQTPLQGPAQPIPPGEQSFAFLSGADRRRQCIVRLLFQPVRFLWRNFLYQCQIGT